jgi:hypothetical protein
MFTFLQALFFAKVAQNMTTRYNCIAHLTSLQKGDLLTKETTEITETKDNFIFH